MQPAEVKIAKGTDFENPAMGTKTRSSQDSEASIVSDPHIMINVTPANIDKDFIYLSASQKPSLKIDDLPVAEPAATVQSSIEDHDVSPTAHLPSVLPQQDETVVKDDEYYFCMVNVEVEEVKFLIPYWGFHKAGKGSMFDIPLDEDSEELFWELAPDEHIRHFRLILAFMYPLNPMKPVKRSRAAWKYLLRITTRWHMAHFRKQALMKFSDYPGYFNLTPEEKWDLGQSCGVLGWYRAGCEAFVSGEIELKAHHADTLGIEALMRFIRVRDEAYKSDVKRHHRENRSFLASVFEGIPLDRGRVGDAGKPKSSTSIIEEIKEAREHGLSGYLQFCYERLAERKESLTLEEIYALGLETAIGLWKARLRLFKIYHGPSRPVDFSMCIVKEFYEELACTLSLEQTFKGVIA